MSSSAHRPKPAVGVWVRLAKCYGLVLREVREAQGGSPLTLAQFDALAQLLRRPDGMTAGQLSEALLVTAGNIVDAREAERIGLYNKVVADELLRDEARLFAEKLAKGPLFGLAMTKDLLNREALMDLSGALETEAQAQAVCMQHPDFREAYEAFMAKREPRFRG